MLEVISVVQSKTRFSITEISFVYRTNRMINKLQTSDHITKSEENTIISINAFMDNAELNFSQEFSQYKD